MADSIYVDVIETEKIAISLAEPQAINITLGQTYDAELATKIAQLLSIFEPPEGDWRVVKLYVPSHPPYKLKVEYEEE